MMISADRDVCVAACETLNVPVGLETNLLKAMKGLKGSIGGALADAFIVRHPYSTDVVWPAPLERLVGLLRSVLGTTAGEGETSE